MKRQHMTISLTAAELSALRLIATLGLGDLEGDDSYPARVARSAERALKKVVEVACKHNLETH